MRARSPANSRILSVTENDSGAESSPGVSAVRTIRARPMVTPSASGSRTEPGSARAPAEPRRKGGQGAQAGNGHVRRRGFCAG